MSRRLRRCSGRLRNVEAHGITTAALLSAVLSPFGDLISAEMKMTVCTAGIGLLVHRLAVRPEPGEPLLHAREELQRTEIHERLRSAREVWMFAPSGQNFLNTVNRTVLREHLLGHGRGVLRAVILDPSNPALVEVTDRHLRGERPGRPFGEALIWAHDELHALCEDGATGAGTVRTLDFNPGFSIVVIDPKSRDGLAIVEFHGFQNASSAARMHLHLTPSEAPWYGYWLDQFEQLWDTAGTLRSRASLEV